MTHPSRPERIPCVYIMASRPGGALYVGVTSDLVRRVWTHKFGDAEGFARRCNAASLVWWERHETMESAISREKAIKKWRRGWKERLVGEANPSWRDLYEDIL